ncbi:MAG: tripartite tricarboxylate transporter TctB family protein [Sulfolobales archaeon]|jgi:putative tricarboxylic transport membrane protein
MVGGFKPGSFFFSIFLLVISVLLLRESFKINTLGIGWGGPRFFPQTLITFLLLLSIILVVVEGGKFFKYLTLNRNNRVPSVRWGEVLPVILVLVASLTYVLVIKIVGYFITTFTLSFIVSLMFRARVLDALLIATVITLSIWFLFKVLLSVPLPEGMFGW